jgi:hypothetical protein
VRCCNAFVRAANPQHRRGPAGSYAASSDAGRAPHRHDARKSTVRVEHARCRRGDARGLMQAARRIGNGPRSSRCCRRLVGLAVRADAIREPSSRRSCTSSPPAVSGGPCPRTSRRARRCKAISTAGATTAPGIVSMLGWWRVLAKAKGASRLPRPASSTARARRSPKATARVASMPVNASRDASAISSPIQKASCSRCGSMRPTSKTRTAPCRCCARCAEIAALGGSRSSSAPPGVKGFELLPRRWVVERTFAWLGRNRRLTKDFEATIDSATAWLLLANLRLLSRRLARV